MKRKKDAPTGPRLYVDATGFVSALEERQKDAEDELARMFPDPSSVSVTGLAARMTYIAKVDALRMAIVAARDAAHTVASLSLAGRDYGIEAQARLRSRGRA